MAEDRDSARIGRAVEYLVASTCILSSNLKLNVSTSLVDDEGVDLVFHRRDCPTTLAVQVKSRTTTAKGIAKREKFQAFINASTFAPRKDLYLLFALVDAETGTLPILWFVPSRDFAAKTKSDTQRRRFVASTKTGSKNQWRKYRLSQLELAPRILNVIDEVGGGSVDIPAEGQ